MNNEVKIETDGDGSGPSKALQEFNAEIAALAAKATPTEVAEATALGVSGQPARAIVLSPGTAAVLYTFHNPLNRNFTISKAYGMREMIQRGAFKMHHQGIAFYPDGNLADGQHRVAACALSGTKIPLMVFNDFDKDAIDAIDRAKGRTLGEALTMLGVADANIVATTAKIVFAYMFERDHKTKPYIDDPKLERWVQQNREVVGQSVEIGRNSTRNISEPSMSQALATQYALLMLLGGWTSDRVVGFIASVQQGVATYPEAPTVELSRKLMKSAYAEKKKDKLSSREKLALGLKAASLWDRSMSIGRLNWNATKEELPDYHPVATADTQEAA
jgi:hypothetical protein